MSGKWIAEALSKPGSKGKLHRELGVPEGKKIPAKAMSKACHSKDATIKKEAVLAKTLSKMHKK